MKKFNIINSWVMVLVSAFALGACSDDEESKVSFSKVYEIYDESKGTATLTVPVTGANGSLEYSLSGSAIEGVDYKVISLTGESGLQIEVLDDGIYEPQNETVIVRLKSANARNKEFTLEIQSNCADYKSSDFSAAFWAGEFDALEDYGSSTYGPYHVTFVQDEEDPNKFWFDNFWDSGIEAYVVYDPLTNTVIFPEQETDGGDIITGTGTFDPCSESFTISTQFTDGDSEWDYRFKKLNY